MRAVGSPHPYLFYNACCRCSYIIRDVDIVPAAVNFIVVVDDGVFIVIFIDAVDILTDDMSPTTN